MCKQKREISILDSIGSCVIHCSFLQLFNVRLDTVKTISSLYLLPRTLSLITYLCFFPAISGKPANMLREALCAAVISSFVANYFSAKFSSLLLHVLFTLLSFGVAFWGVAIWSIFLYPLYFSPYLALPQAPVSPVSVREPWRN